MARKLPSDAKRRRTRRVPLSRERILRRAIEQADRNGIESLSMRRLAASLGVEAMSLYNHVANKDEICDGMVDLVVSEIDLPTGAADWKAAMRRRAISAHEVLLRHPWAAALFESRTTLSPVRLRYTDSVLGVLREAGFSIELAYNAFLTLDSYVYGFTLQEVNWAHKPEEVPSVIERLSPQVPVDEHPHLAEVMGFVMRSRTERAASAYESEFQFGLDLILDGFEALRNKG
jgi:AcrR family transcriptional regulator